MMNAATVLALAGLLLLTGCTSRPLVQSTGAQTGEKGASAANTSAPAYRTTQGAAGRAERRDDTAPIALGAYEVREAAFTDFGMSVRTNVEVKWGGSVQWMRIIAVQPGSDAAARGLGAGDAILAIDGRQIVDYDRDAMLAALFLRQKGDRVELLILGPETALPRFVSLRAEPPPRRAAGPRK